MNHSFKIVALLALFLFRASALAGAGDTSWMLQAKYGIFLHYQHRILLGYSYGTAALGTKPKLPPVAEMTTEGWNRFVDGFDAQGFADQMAEGQVGWVLFCLDDHYFGWPCAPNQTFDHYTGYAPGQKCSRRDLIGDVADALAARGIRLICYYAGLNGCMREPQASAGLKDDGDETTPPSAECRKRRIEVLQEFADRYRDKVAGWWFDGVMPDSYREPPHDWRAIQAVVLKANPKSVIAFSWGRNRQACMCPGVDDFTSGDSYAKQDLTRLTPKNMPAQAGILWHGKIYCGDVYHGQGNANQFSDQELIDWIKMCNRQGGVCTLDWPFDPQTGLLKDFGIAQLKRIARAVKANSPHPQSRVTGQTSQFYVAVEEKRANDDNDGTCAVYQSDKVGPWRTIQRALRAARPGDTIFVGRGRYTEELSITTPRIRLRALDGAKPLIDGENVRRYGIRNPDTAPAEEVLIEGFEIANHTTAGVMIAGRGSRGVTIRSNIVHHAGDKGIDVRGTGHRIESNIVFMIGNNQEAMGIHLAAASDCLVQGNDVFLCKKTAIRDQSGQRNTIQGNLMHQCWTGLDYNACSGARAFNNYIYDNSQGFNPKHVKGDAGWNLFWHNTLYDSHGPHVSIAVNRADNSEGPGPDCDYLDIRNNILVKAGHTHIWNKPDIVGDHLIIDHNLYFGPPGWPPFFYHTEWPRGGRPGMATLEQVRRQTPFEAGGRVVDPLLIDPEAGNLAYSDASPAQAGGAKLDSPLGAQLGARGVRKPVTRFVPVRLKAIKASVNENLMGYTTDGRSCTGWHSGTETANQWILYEIEGAEAFTHLILVPVAHKVEFNVRRYEFSVSDDNQTYRPLRAGENNDSGSWFIYEFDKPVSAKFLRFTLLDKFPDDGYTWTLNRLEFDELRAGRLDPPVGSVIQVR